MLNEEKILDITEKIRAKQIQTFKQYSVDLTNECIYWIIHNASILYVNETACHTLGYSYDELINLTVHDINPDYPVETWKENWLKLKKLGTITFETRHKSKDGIFIPVEVTANYVEHEGYEYSCAFVKNISDRKQAEDVLYRKNCALNIISQFNHTLVHATEEPELLEDVCRIIIDNSNYQTAWIGLKKEHNESSLERLTIYPVTQSGYKESGMDIFESTWMDIDLISDVLGSTIKTGKPYINHNLKTGSDNTVWNNLAIKYGFKSSITLPLITNQQIMGILVIYARELNAFNAEETELLVKLTSNLAFGMQTVRDRREQMKTQMFSVIERKANKIISSNIALNEQLATLNRAIEAQFPEIICSILLLDVNKKQLFFGAADNLPIAFKYIFDGILIGQSAPACGNAAYSGSKVISTDIKTDANWSRYNSIISKFSIQSCWSTPIRSLSGSVLGTFACYFTENKSPDTDDYQMLEFFASTAGMIIEKNKPDEIIYASEKRYQYLYNHSPMILLNLDINGKILSINSYGAQTLGYLACELINEKIDKIIFEDDQQFMHAQLEKCFTNHDNLLQWEIRKKKKARNVIWTKETARIIKENNNSSSLFIICEDVTETHTLTEKLSHQAIHDSLTGLFNRKEFEYQLETKIQESTINKTEHALCYLDLDQFKVVNDTCGHKAGDELLKQISKKMHTRIRKRDIFARLGGDEFGVLIESCSLEQAMRVANELREVIKNFNFVWKGKRFSLGVSIGLVPINYTSGDVISLMRAADAACYVAKESGRNRLHVYHPDDTDLSKWRSEMQWVTQITQALEENRLILNYQPIIPVNEEDYLGKHFELLIRMKNDKGENIPPSSFLPAAERYNLSGKLDIWVINSAFLWLDELHDGLIDLHLCNINLSCLSLVDEDVLKFILTKFNEGKVPPEKICFEITETAAISHIESATLFINTLKDLGCKFALDDFGSGLSSFSYLRNLPVDYLKIDGNFVRNIAINKIDFAMVRSINEIGKLMEKQTIAEYVENDEILEKLRDIGVDYAQGYCIGKPTPVVMQS